MSSDDPVMIVVSLRVLVIWDTCVLSKQTCIVSLRLLSDIDIQTHGVDSSTCDRGRVPRRDGVAWGVTSVRGCLGVLVDTPIVHAQHESVWALSWSGVR